MILLLLLAVWLVLTVGSLAVVIKVVLTLPEDYFEVEQPRDMPRTPRRIGRNLAGLLLILIGAALSVPGIPGQGLLTILVGLFLIDFPGRQRVERRIARRPAILSALNRLRARFGGPPLRPPRP
jgi:hypothetical protein